MNPLRRILARRELLYNLVLREVRGKYRRTALGQLWSLLNPLASMVVYTVVFALIIRADPGPGDPSGIDSYPLWLLAGLLPWLFFSHVLTGGISSIIANGSLIKKVYFPRIVLPMAVVGAVGFTWLIEIGVLSVAISIVGGFVLPFLPLVLLFMIALAMFAAGLALLLALANAYFRDVQHLTAIVLQLWLYLTPIIYPVRLVEEAARERGEWLLVLYRANPLEHFVLVFRNLLYDNRLPEPMDMIICTAWAIVAFAFGSVVFVRKEKRLAELL